MARKKRSFKGKKLTSAELQKRILVLFKNNPKGKYSPKQIINRLNIVNSKDSVQSALDKLNKSGLLSKKDTPKFKVIPKTFYKQFNDTLEGVVDMTRTGSAYISTEGSDQDIYIPAKRLHGALHGDTVKIRAFYPKGRRKPEGEILAVLERATDHFIGTVQKSRNYNLVIPDKENLAFDIIIPENKMRNAQEGEKVVVKIIEWPSKKKPTPVGEITTVLGKEGSSDIEMKSILVGAGFPLDFPDEVMKEANALKDKITKQELSRRLDLREVVTFTIDPADAKDFDDALSIQLLENGLLEVGVHIADVTHFVKPKTALDQEAYKRATSVYLVDRVLPMLPEKISNKLCSLRPNEDKYTFSAIFHVNEKNKIVKEWFGKTVIHSDKRFTYEEAQDVIEAGKGTFYDELLNLNKLAKHLKKARFKNGSINFETDEVKFKLDEDGTPLGIYLKERKDAHKLVEEFMLLANKRVAKYMSKKAKGKEIPYIYRVHDLPNADKVNDFALFAKELGVTMQTDTPEQISKSYNSMMKLVAKDPALKVLESLAIRTMAKAEYSADNIGHYGLAFQFYSHFTSPIRRYSDVLAHRILEENLKSEYMVNKAKLELKCKHISKMERKAMGAERESIKYKQVEYHENQVGNEFDAFVTGFSERGFFVETATSKAEGMISYSSLGEHFELEAGRMKARGATSGKVIKMGDKIKVRIKATNLDKRQIDFELAKPN